MSNNFDTLFTRSGDIEGAQRALESAGLIRTVQIGPTKSCIYIGPRDGLSLEDQYKRIGVVTIEVIPPSEVARVQADFLETLANFPEYKRGSDEPTFYVAGGFGGFGNPASFHNPLVRELIRKAYPTAKEFNQKVFSHDPKLNFSAIKDRMMFRPAGKVPPAEAWHRDVIGKEVQGGWINTGTHSQYFTFIPGTHLGFDSKVDEGFALVANHIDPNELKPYQYRMEIKPGHMIIFPQYIIHTVEAKKQAHDMTRVFAGWFITESNHSLYCDADGNDQLDRILDDQAVPHLPGGMIPPLFSPNHYNFLFKPFDWGYGVKMNLADWAEKTFKPEVQIQKYSKTHDRTYTCVPRYMKSLREYGFPLYPPYSDEERALYKPSKLYEK